MTRKKRTVITEESHEIWIIRHSDDIQSSNPSDSGATDADESLLFLPPHFDSPTPDSDCGEASSLDDPQFEPDQGD